MGRYHILKATKQRKFNKNLFGFDIETYDNNKKFYCASIYSDNPNFSKTFFDKDSCIEYFKKKRFHNSIVSATNLQFDFFGLLHNKEDIKKFRMLWRGSSMLYAETYFNGREFISFPDKKKDSDKSKQYRKLTFIDTGNYTPLSVEKLGSIIGIEKIKKPPFIGKKPKTAKEKEEMIAYNMRDAEISQKAIRFIYDSFQALGASCKLTIASSSLSLYRNKYLYRDYFRHDIELLLEQFKGYYGGRCEAFYRGEIRNMKYYDFNSLYPSVMVNEYPNPNTKRITYKDTTFYIENFDGVSDVELFCPDMEYPLIPLRHDNKLYFPTGTFRGWHSHIELRKALELGYIIKKVYKSIYFTENCIPFRDFIEEMYSLRLKYQKDKNPMESVIKLLMNSLYGKFGQKFTDKDNWIPVDSITIEELNKMDFVERFGDFFRIKNNFIEPQAFCIPIWALYTTAYGRLKLYDALKSSKAFYCDTDSIITNKEFLDSERLGKLKLERNIKYGVIVKPKMYGFIEHDNKEFVKIKGLGIRLSYDEFIDFLKDPVKRYKKFMKFKESMRRNFTPNEIQYIIKALDLEDNKRLWDKPFDFHILQYSRPVNFLAPKIERFI